MFAAVGIDLVEIERVRQALRRRPRLAARLFTEEERAYCERYTDPAPHYAARFAAKEAMAKALGRWLRWHEVQVLNDPSGRPLLALTGEAAALVRFDCDGQAIVSLSHSRDYAIACVVVVQREEGGSPASNPPGLKVPA